MTTTAADPFVDPGEPGELKGSLKAKDLINLPCLFRVTDEGMWPAKDAFTDENGKKHRAQPPSPYLECDVVVLGAGGIENHGSGVRISWARVVPSQISIANRGQWVPARPKRDDDNSVYLMTFDAKGKQLAAALLPEVEELFVVGESAAVADALNATPVPPGYDPEEDPF